MSITTKKIIRFLLYLLGVAILSFGIVLNTKTNLGVSPINAMPYAVSVISGFSLGTITIFFYIGYILLQILLMRKRFTPKTLLQLPFGILFGIYINLFNDYLAIDAKNYLFRIILLVIAILCTALGVVITVGMDIVPNPADGLTKELSISLHKEFGLTKNCFDAVSVLITIAISLVFSDHIIGIGIGTLVSVLGIGRTIAFINKYLKEKLEVFGKQLIF